MGLLKLPGLGSGLDTDGLVKTLMSLERRPLTGLQKKRDDMTTEASAWRDLNTRVLTLQKRIEELNNLTSADWTARKSSVSDGSLLTLGVTESTAATGSYAVEVTALATATVWQSGIMVDGGGLPKLIDDPTKQLGLAGTIQISSGGGNNGKSFTIAATDSLNDIVTKINNDGINLAITASVSQVNPGDYRLVLKGANGAASDFSLSDASGTAAAQLQLTDAANKQATAANGSMKVNGSTVTFAQNTIKDAVGGVSFTVNKTGTATVTVSKDQSKITDAVKKVVDQYNSVVEFIDSLTSYDSKTKKAGTLFGDQRINDLRDGLRKQIMDKVKDAPDAYNSLGIVGVTTQAFASGTDYAGKLTFDTDKFAKALDTNPNAMRSMFNDSTTGIATRVRAYLDNYTRTGGILPGRAEAIDKGVDLIKKEISRWEEQILPKREQRLRDQFLGLEKAMSSLQNQGNWLSAQIKSLGGSNQ